ncbi:VTT domain-containing protein [uncultured Sphingomonas sp.]|uniref:DedA family protein n=1 Tax=uncultured Sphingomonas sp. TaxID=158754 RepID=UPI0025DACDF8|nr:VTT domain-containing protein [uncultured Sphingomonas sp.]
MADGSGILSIEAIVARYGVIAIAFGAGVEGETAVVTGGILAHQGLIAWPAAFFAAAIGSFVADQIFFTFGRRARDGRWVRKLKRRRVYTRVTRLMERYPVGFIFGFRFLYGLRTISPVALGTSTVSTRLFVAVNAASAACWAAMFTGIGYLFGEAFQELAARYRPSLAHILMAAALVMVAATIGWGLHTLWQRHKESNEQA